MLSCFDILGYYKEQKKTADPYLQKKRNQKTGPCKMSIKSQDKKKNKDCGRG